VNSPSARHGNGALALSFLGFRLIWQAKTGREICAIIVYQGAIIAQKQFFRIDSAKTNA